MVVPRTSSIQKVAPRDTCAECAGRLCRNSNHCVDVLDEIPFRRFHRRCLESAAAWVDSETILGLVVASNFYSPWDVDVRVRIDCQLLARRIHVARAAYRLKGNGFVLHLFLARPCCDYRHFAFAKGSQESHRSAASRAMAGCYLLWYRSHFSWFSVASIRFRPLHQSIA